MKTGTIVFSDFKGIVTSVANPPHNTFKALVNLRLDVKFDGLVNRFGYRPYKQNGSYVIPSVDSYDLIAVARFNNKSSLISVGPYGDDKMLSVITDGTESIINPLTVPIQCRIDSITSTQLVFLKSEWPSDLIYANALGMVIGNKSLVFPSDDIGPWFLPYMKMTYVTVTAVATDSTYVYLTINKDVSLSWNAGDISWFLKGIPFNYSIISSPKAITVDGNNSIIIAGIKETLTNQSTWIGYIKERSFFNNSFTQDGVYRASFMEDFSYGAFTNKDFHIYTKVTDALSPAVNLDPDASNALFGQTSPTIKDETDTVISASVWHDHVNQAGGDAVYLKLDQPAGQSGSRTLEFSLPHITDFIDPDSSIVLKTRFKIVSSVIPYNTRFRAILWDASTNSAVTFVGREAPTGGQFIELISEIKISQISSVNNLKLRLYFSCDGEATIYCSMVRVLYNPRSVSTITVPASNPVYAVSFSLVLDGVNETALIYSNIYGDVVSADTYKQSNNFLLGGSTTTKNAIVKIVTNNPDLINRRVTSINIYGGQQLIKDFVWRLCRSVDINDSQWKFDSTTHECYIEIPIGNEINTGSLYTDRNYAAPDDNLAHAIKYATVLGGRLYIVDESSGSMVFYSQFATSVISPSNFFIIAGNDDINGLSSLNSRLVVFKRSSYYSGSITDEYGSVKIEPISTSHGLASINSIASSGRLLFFLSYDGVYLTDGFKEERIGSEWISDFLNYTTAQKESASAYFCSHTNSYNLHIGDDIWCYDIIVRSWRKEDYTHSDSNGTSGENPVLFGTDVDGTTIFSDQSKLSLYEYPRRDGSHLDTYRHYMGADIFYADAGVDTEFLTNEFYPEDSIRQVMRTKDGYVLGENISGLKLGITAGSYSKFVYPTGDSSVFSLVSNNPLSSLSLSGELTMGANRTIIKKVGINLTVTKRVGSVRSL